MTYYNKVVRDNIPSIIEQSGKKYEVHELNDDDFLVGLKTKLLEEINEFNDGEDVAELADVLEVVYAIARLKGVSREKLEEIRKAKADSNGGFDNNLYLVKTYD